MAYILRRRKLGKTSAREIALQSSTDIKVFRNDNTIAGRTHRYDHVDNRYVREPLPTNPDVVFRWGCISSVAGNPVIVNHSSAIGEVNDKGAFRKLCADANIAPKTWLPNDSVSDLTFPVVVRRNQHAQGRHLHVCQNRDEFNAAKNRYPGNWYASLLVQKVAEFRVFIAQGRVVWVAKKTPGNPEQVAWNVAQGGRFDNVPFSEWPLRAVRVSVEAMNLTELDFGGVDVMIDTEGKAHILEINSAPSQTSPYRQSCVAKVFDYIVRNGKAKIPLVEERGNWQKFIHPAVSAAALISN